MTSQIFPFMTQSPRSRISIGFFNLSINLKKRWQIEQATNKAGIDNCIYTLWGFWKFLANVLTGKCILKHRQGSIIQGRPPCSNVGKILFTGFKYKIGSDMRKMDRETNTFFMYYFTDFLLHSCMRKGAVGNRDSSSFPGRVTKPFKIPGDYEKCKHRCLYLLFMTGNCLHYWFLDT